MSLTRVVQFIAPVLAFVAGVGDTAVNAPTVSFDGEIFALQHIVTRPSEVVNEYVPASDDANWRRMIAVRWFSGLTSHREAVANLIKSLLAQNPQARYSAWDLDMEEATGVDFITWQDDLFIEFNIFIYRPDLSGVGLVAHQYAMRAYGDEQRSFMERLSETRKVMIKKVIAFRFPEVITE